MQTRKKREKDRARGERGGLGRSFVATWKFSLQTLNMQPSPELTDHQSHTSILHLRWENIPKEPRVKKTQFCWKGHFCKHQWGTSIQAVELCGCFHFWTAVPCSEDENLCRFISHAAAGSLYCHRAALLWTYLSHHFSICFVECNIVTTTLETTTTTKNLGSVWSRNKASSRKDENYRISTNGSRGDWWGCQCPTGQDWQRQQ